MDGACAAGLRQEAREWDILAPMGARVALTLRRADEEELYTLPAQLVTY